MSACDGGCVVWLEDWCVVDREDLEGIGDIERTVGNTLPIRDGVGEGNGAVEIGSWSEGPTNSGITGEGALRCVAEG